MDDTILTLHPEGKKGVKILKRRYDLIKKAILTILEADGPCSAQYLDDKINERLSFLFSGHVSRYVITVIRDLEARKIIKIVTDGKPQLIKINTRLKRI